MSTGSTLQECLAAYILERPLTAKAAYQLQHSIALFERCVGRVRDVASITESSISAWLQQLQPTLGARSVYNHRANLLAVLRYAVESGMRGPFASYRIRRVRRPKPAPVAWTLDEIERILAACRATRGIFLVTGAPRALYLTTLCLAGWDTGLRRSDLWRLPRKLVRADGTVMLRQHKTGFAQWPRLRAEALHGFDALPGDPPLRSPYASDTDFYRAWHRVIIAADVRPGCLQQLRRSAATHLAIEHPEAVQRYLGHSSPEMSAWYVDWSIARPQQFLPPELPAT